MAGSITFFLLIHLLIYTPIYSCNNHTNRNNSILYQWTPSNACTHPLSKFNRNEVCRLMRGRTLVFIGDSLSLHHYETTLTAIGERFRPLFTHLLIHIKLLTFFLICM